MQELKPRAHPGYIPGWNIQESFSTWNHLLDGVAMVFQERTFGDIHVSILGAESMGVRSMCTKVRTPDLCMMLDPGCSLGPRKEHAIPHPVEYRRLHQVTDRIIEESRECDVFCVSHYHHDHFKPRMRDELYIHSTPEIVLELYRGKDLFLKSDRMHIGYNQKKRAKYFKQSVSKLVGKIISADFYRYTIGNTILEFSWPVFHGEQGTKLGHVILARIRYGDHAFIFAPDVQGPVVESTLKFFKDRPCDAAFIGGPPFYLKESLPDFPFGAAARNLKELMENVPLIIVDHHSARDASEHLKFLESLNDAGREINADIMDAATFMGEKPSFLESDRARFFSEDPPSEEFLAWMRLPRDRQQLVPPPFDS